MTIKPTPTFLRDIKFLQKKYPSVPNDLRAFKESLQANPQQGEALGKNCYKVRFDIKSKNTGKRDNSRIITCVKIVDDVIHLLAVYDKAERATVPDKELKDVLKQIED
jgi:mRNA-degrading endonuclease RelE of RelBE toxin-antitoxin system